MRSNEEYVFSDQILWKFLQPSLSNGPLGKQNTETTSVCCLLPGCYVRKKNLPLPLELIGLLAISSSARVLFVSREWTAISVAISPLTNVQQTPIYIYRYHVYMLLNLWLYTDNLLHLHWVVSVCLCPSRCSKERKGSLSPTSHGQNREEYPK